MSDPLVFRCASCGGVNRVDAARVVKGPSCGRCKGALDTTGAPIHLDDAQLEANARMAGSLGVQGSPALFVFQGGRVVGQKAGALPLPALRAWTQGVLPPQVRT